MTMIGLLVVSFSVVCYLSVALPASGRIARGGLVGLRIPSTKRSDEAWLAAHRAVLPLVTVVTGVTSMVGILIVLDRPPLGLSPETAAGVGMTFTVVGLLIATVLADRAARAVTTEGSAAESGAGVKRS